MNKIRWWTGATVVLWISSFVVVILDIDKGVDQFASGTGVILGMLALGMTQILTVRWLVETLKLEYMRETLDDLALRRFLKHGGEGRR